MKVDMRIPFVIVAASTVFAVGVGCTERILSVAPGPIMYLDAGQDGRADRQGQRNSEPSLDVDTDAGKGETKLPSRAPRWTALTLQTSIGQVTSVWGSSASDVWFVANAAGGSAILHYDGAAVRGWNVNATLKAVWGTTREDAWILGDRGAYITWDGTSWTSQPRFTSGDVVSTWGSDTAWAVGEHIGGSNLHRTDTNHTDWNLGSQYDLPREANGKLNTVSGSDGRVYVSGVPGTWVRDGQWLFLTSHEMLNIYGLPGGVVATDSFNVWFIFGSNVARTDAQPPDVSVSTSLLRAVWAKSGRDVWVAGTKGYLAHFNGVTWTRAPAVTNSDLDCIWGTATDDIWAGGDNILLHYGPP